MSSQQDFISRLTLSNLLSARSLLSHSHGGASKMLRATGHARMVRLTGRHMCERGVLSEFPAACAQASYCFDKGQAPIQFMVTKTAVCSCGIASRYKCLSSFSSSSSSSNISSLSCLNVSRARGLEHSFKSSYCISESD